MNQKLILAILPMLFLDYVNAYAQSRQWQPIGPWGGRIDDIAIAPSQTNILYALQEITVLKSIDYGLTWMETNPINRINNRPIQGLHRMTIHPDFSDHLYLGGGETLRRSFDGGESWEAIIDTLGFGFDEVIFNPQNHNTIFAPAFDLTIEDFIKGGGIFKSIDGGNTWKLLDSLFIGKSVLGFAISPSDTAILYLLLDEAYPMANKLYRSSNNGEQWEEIETGNAESLVQIVMSQSNPSTIYAINFDLITNSYGVIRTDDAGQSWSQADNDLPPAVIRSLNIDPRNSNRVYAAVGGFYFDEGFARKQAHGIYLTSDGGQSWNRIANTLEDTLFHDIEIDPLHSDTLYLAAEVFSVYASGDGGVSWELRNANIHNISGPFAVNPDNPNVIHMITRAGILRTLDAGQTWNRILWFIRNHDELTIALAPSEPNIIYAAATRQNRSNMKSQDGGDTWTVWPDSVLPPDETVMFIVDPTRSQIVYAFSSTGIFKSSDAGETWHLKNDGLISHPVSGRTFVQALAFNPLNASSLYAATYKGLFKSINSGEHWHRLGTDSTDINAVAVSSFDTLLIYTGTSSFLSAFGRLRVSRDEGASWQEMNPPAMMEVSNFAIDPNNPSMIWITTINEFTFTSQVFFSTDGGVHWEPSNDGLPSSEISKIFLPLSERHTLYALTTLYGLYRFDFPTGVWGRRDQVPDEFQLFQNYPNPFGGSPSHLSEASKMNLFSHTRIEYRLSSVNHIELTIHNILGQIIVSLVKREQIPGFYRVEWDGKDSNDQFVPAGVYFVKLATPRAFQVKKIIIVR